MYVCIYVLNIYICIQIYMFRTYIHTYIEHIHIQTKSLLSVICFKDLRRVLESAETTLRTEAADSRGYVYSVYTIYIHIHIHA